MTRNPAIEERDENAIFVAQKSKMPEDMRRDTWGKMWDMTPERQEEFGERNHFVAYMEGRFRGVIKNRTSYARSQKTRDQQITEEDDAKTLDLAKARGLSKDERCAMWSDMYQQSPERQHEFIGGESSYVAFMEACFRRVSKVHGWSRIQR